MNYGCTTYTLVIRSKRIFGRNLDVDSDFGYIFCNPRNISKTAYMPANSNKVRAKWTSKYGSISFNQIALDIPHGGMNEAGLVVEHLFLEESKYEPVDERPVLISHQWVQFILDNCKDVKEAIAIQSEVRISNKNFKFPIHFHLMDKKGKRAIFEYLNGECKIYSGRAYKIGVLANSSYEDSLLSGQNNVNLSHMPTDISTSINRFNKASELIEEWPVTNNDISYAFSILDSVLEGTKWQIVFDLEHLEIHFRTESFNEIQKIRINDMNFSGGVPKHHKINAGILPYNEWKNITIESNENILKGICKKSEFINSILGEEIKEIAASSLML